MTEIRAKHGGDRGIQLWQHECGHVQDLSVFAKPDDETVTARCEECAAGPSTWRRLYAKAKFS